MKRVLILLAAVLVTGCARKKPTPTPEPIAVPAPKPKNPDLVGHWTLDGGKAEDASGYGHHGLLKGGPIAVDGKIGGALTFDGVDDYVEIPMTPKLQGVNHGSYTISAWFNPAIVPPGTDSDNDACYSILTRTGWHEGLRYDASQHFVHDHWMAGDEPVATSAGTWDTPFDPGRFHHVVSVVDKSSGEMTIYVNGFEESTAEFDPTADAREYGNMPWRIGIGSPGAEKWSWPAKGVIDDVRLYNRALSASEIEALSKAGK